MKKAWKIVAIILGIILALGICAGGVYLILEKTNVREKCEHSWVALDADENREFRGARCWKCGQEEEFDMDLKFQPYVYTSEDKLGWGMEVLVLQSDFEKLEEYFGEVNYLFCQAKTEELTDGCVLSIDNEEISVLFDDPYINEKKQVGEETYIRGGFRISTTEDVSYTVFLCMKIGDKYFYTEAQTYTLGEVAEKLYLDESYTGNKETLKPYLSEEFKAEHGIDVIEPTGENETAADQIG